MRTLSTLSVTAIGNDVIALGERNLPHALAARRRANDVLPMGVYFLDASS